MTFRKPVGCSFTELRRTYGELGGDYVWHTSSYSNPFSLKSLLTHQLKSVLTYKLDSLTFQSGSDDSKGLWDLQ